MSKRFRLTDVLKVADQKEKERKAAQSTTVESTIVPSTTVQSTPPQSEPLVQHTVEPPTPPSVPQSTVVQKTIVQSENHIAGSAPVFPLPEQPRDAIKREYTKVPNYLIGGALKALNPASQVVYLHLIQLTIGHNRRRCTIGHGRLAERTGFSKSGIQKAVQQLKEFRYVKVLGDDNSASNKHDRGSVYEVYLPGESLPQGTTVQSTTVQSRTGALSGPMKEIMKESHERPVAGAPAIDIFGIRTIAARLFEAHRSSPGFDHDRLRGLVRDVLIGQGSAADEATIEEAIRGMGSP